MDPSGSLVNPQRFHLKYNDIDIHVHYVGRIGASFEDVNGSTQMILER